MHPALIHHPSKAKQQFHPNLAGKNIPIMSLSLQRPPLHPDLLEVHKTFPLHEEIGSAEDIATRRKTLDFSLEDTIRGKEDLLTHEEREIPGPTGPLKASIFRPKTQQKPGQQVPGIVHIRGADIAAETVSWDWKVCWAGSTSLV